YLLCDADQPSYGGIQSVLGPDLDALVQAHRGSMVPLQAGGQGNQRQGHDNSRIGIRRSTGLWIGLGNEGSGPSGHHASPRPRVGSMSEHATPQDSAHQATYVEPGREFNRDTNYIDTRITADGRDGYPVEAGRYRLVAARACPWANRALIVRRLLGLEDAISLGLCGPTHDARSWTFDLDPGGVDPVLGIERLQEAYFRRYPDYPRG